MASRETKPRRTRAYAPKVRTGCITCKQRRKKCDEEKPICRRCREQKYVCDGYSRTSAAKAWSTSLSQPLDAARPRCILPGNGLEQQYLNHFFTCAIQDLIGPTSSGAFWSQNLVGLSHDVPFIRPAVVALGVTHWLFMTTSGDIPRLQSFAVSQYNEAIAHLVPTMATWTLGNITPVLTCCLLFVFLESLRGNQSEALRHLEAGSRLIVDQSATLPTTSDDKVRALITMFHSLGAQATMFSETQILPNLEPYFRQPRVSEDSQQFSNMDEAEDALAEFDDLFNYICWDTEEYLSAEAYEEKPSSEDCPEWRELKRRFQAWSAQFRRTVEFTTANDLTPNLRQQILYLQLQERIWELTFQGEDDLEAGLLEPEGCQEILDQIKQLMSFSASRPTFTLKGGLIPAIIFLYSSCSDIDTRCQVISLLRSQRRREIIWDSEAVAEFLDKDLKSCLISNTSSKEWPKIGPSSDLGALVIFRPRV